MRRMIPVIAGGVLAGVLVNAGAQTAQEVTIEATRPVTTTEHTMPGQVPVVRASLSYTVSANGLDLATSAGTKEFERRVSEAAAAVCKELARQFPKSLTSEAECARTAKAQGMPKVRELEAAAAKSAQK
jgi:UrcA family protein